MLVNDKAFVVHLTKETKKQYKPKKENKSSCPSCSLESLAVVDDTIFELNAVDEVADDRIFELETVDELSNEIKTVQKKLNNK